MNKAENLKKIKPSKTSSEKARHTQTYDDVTSGAATCLII